MSQFLRLSDGMGVARVTQPPRTSDRDTPPLPRPLWERLCALPTTFYGRVEIDYRAGRPAGYRIVESFTVNEKDAA